MNIPPQKEEYSSLLDKATNDHSYCEICKITSLDFCEISNKERFIQKIFVKIKNIYVYKVNN